MLNNNFTVEEVNLMAIYRDDTAAATLANIVAAYEFIDDEDIIAVAESASRKLAVMSDE